MSLDTLQAFIFSDIVAHWWHRDRGRQPQDAVDIALRIDDDSYAALIDQVTPMRSAGLSRVVGLK